MCDHQNVKLQFLQIITAILFVLLSSVISSIRPFHLWCTRSSNSKWILMSCQPQGHLRVTSGQLNSDHKQIHISKLTHCLFVLLCFCLFLCYCCFCLNKLKARPIAALLLLTHIYMYNYLLREFLTLNTLMQKALPFLQTVASKTNKQTKVTGENAQPPLL